MFPRPINYTKLKTNLRLARRSLNLLRKKKSDLIQKCKCQIADSIQLSKFENTRIRITNVLIEECFVEGLDLVDMFCCILIARIDIIMQMKGLENSIAEPVASILWVTPRLQNDIPEFKIVSDILISKYGLPYVEAILMEPLKSINSNLIYNIQMVHPSPMVVEKYMINLTHSYGIFYEPNENIMKEEHTSGMLNIFLTDLDKVSLAEQTFISETTIHSPSTVS